MSKHQDLCYGCTYDNIDNEWYREECWECEYEQLKGDTQPSNYVGSVYLERGEVTHD